MARLTLAAAVLALIVPGVTLADGKKPAPSTVIPASMIGEAKPASCSSCGNEFTTRSTRAEIQVDVCSNCHPAYTGTERQVSRGSRIERFERRRAAAHTKERH